MPNFGPTTGGALSEAQILGVPLLTGDALAIEDEPTVRIEGIEEGEVLLFDLA